MDELFDSDIPWRLQPLPRDVSPPLDPSTPDGLGLVYADVVALELHLASVEADLASYRELVQTSLERLAALTARLTRQNAVIQDQTRQIRALLGMVPVDARRDQHDPDDDPCP